MNRHQAKLKAIEQKMVEEVDAYKAIWAKADEEDREPTQEERLEVEARLKHLEDLKDEKNEVEDTIKVMSDVTDLTKGMRPTGSGIELGENKGIEAVQVPSAQASLGEVFVQSEQYKAIRDEFKGTGVNRQFSTGSIPLEHKGTLLESAGSGLALSTVVPQVQPGVVDKLFQRLTVADALASGQVSTSSLRYVVEGTATSGAAAVAEGGAKPESTLGLSPVDEPVKKIATVLVISDEMLEDAAAVRSYVDSRLSLFVKIEEERELMVGAGGNEIVGLTGRSGVNTYAKGTADNNAVGIFKAMNGTRGSAFLEPDTIIMNPANWQTTRLLTDTAGQFFGGGPFQGPYGNGQRLQDSGQLGGAIDTLWGKPVVITTAVGSGTAVLGSFSQAAQMFTRGGLSVEATNSHQDYFTKNLVAIRAEERLALAVYRPSAFTIVTGLT